MNEHDATLPRSEHASASWLQRVVADRFELESLAGEGGMGTVYRARDRKAGGYVALKLVRAFDAKTVSRFEREAALLRELDDPAIVRYVDSGVVGNGVLYLAMEWLDGEDLADRLVRGPLGVEGSVALARQVANALAVAHARGVVHRDIKPANIFLQDGDLGRVKILDFGIAHAGETARITTRSGGILGTLGYMAPEQARAASDIDAAADVFALGCVLFECITGDPAFHGEHVMSILAKILFEEAPRLRDQGVAVSAELDALVMRMLDKDPKKRPQGGAELARELASLPSDDFRSAVLPRVFVEALGHDEQRLLSIIVSGRPSADAASTPISPDDLRGIATRFEARIERLLDGSLVTTLTSRGSATDQAARAARCALELRALVRDVPMALATGLGEESGAFPMGEVIDRAAALVRKNAPDDFRSVRIDDVTAGLLDPRFDLTRTREMLFLAREGEASAKATRTLLGKPTPCVGRDRELALLAGAYDACVSDSAPRVVLVTAASGVGKTRLRTELTARLAERASAPQVWEGRGDPMSAHAPWIMIAPLLRRAAKIADGDPLETRRRSLAAYVARVAPERNPAKIAAFLGEIVGAPFPSDSSAALRAARGDAIVMGDQARRAFADLVAAETTNGPLLVVLEDLHWGDLPSVALLDFALRTVKGRPWMILALARPEVRSVFPDLWTGRGVTHVELGELSDRASASLVREVLADRASDDVVDRIVARAAGNAFYLEELIRAIADGRGDALPGTVLAMVQARLEALDPETRRTLRAASVFGETFWRSAVAKLLAERADSSDLATTLDDLAEKELISRSDTPSIAGKTEYFFRHAVVREAAYGALTDADRILGHKLAGEWLEECGEPDAMLVAEHLERGAEPARAVAWYRRASEEALAGNDFDGALARADRAMQCGAVGETKGALHLVRCDAHAWKSDHAASLVEASAAAEIFPKASEPWFKAVGRISLECRRLGRVDDVAEWSTRLLASWPAADASNAAVVAACLAADTLYLLGKPSLGSSLIDRVEARLEREKQPDPYVLGHVHRVLGLRVHFRDRDPSAMATSLEKSIAAFDEAGDTRNACVQRANRGFSLLPLGDYAEGERELREAMEIASRLGLLTLVSVCEHNLGTALGRLGRIDEALAAERAAVLAFERSKDVRLEAASRSHLAALELDAGNPEAARREAERAVLLAKSLAGTRAHALATLARIHLEMHEPDLAMRAADDARKLLVELGALEGSEELVRLVYAEALAATGKNEEARAAIADARTRLMERANRISSPRWRATFLAVRECKRICEIASGG